MHAPCMLLLHYPNLPATKRLVFKAASLEFFQRKTREKQVPAEQKKRHPKWKYFNDYLVVFILLFFNHLFGKSSGLQDAEGAWNYG